VKTSQPSTLKALERNAKHEGSDATLTKGGGMAEDRAEE